MSNIDNVEWIRSRVRQCDSAGRSTTVQGGAAVKLRAQSEHVPAEDASAERKAMEQLKRENASLRDLVRRLALSLFIRYVPREDSAEELEAQGALDDAKKAGLL